MKSLSLALVLILGFALAGCHRNLFTGMYSATAEIQIRPRGVVDQLVLGGAHDPEGSALITSEIEIMRSSDVLVPIIDDQKLDQIWAKRFKLDKDALPPQEALDHLNKVLKIELVPKTNIIKVTAYSEVPQEAADIANALVDHYKAMRDQEETDRNRRGVDSLRDIITQQQKVVEKQRQVIENYRGGISTGHDDKDPLAPVRDAQRQLEQQQSLLDALNVRLKQVIADEALMESPVRIISRAVAPPE